MQSAALLELAKPASSDDAITEAQLATLQLLFGNLFSLVACVRELSGGGELELLCLVRNLRGECALVGVTCLLSQNCSFYISSAHPLGEAATVREGEGGEPTLVSCGSTALSYTLAGGQRHFANAVRDAVAAAAGVAPTGWLDHLIQVPLPPPEGEAGAPVAGAAAAADASQDASPGAAVMVSARLLCEPRPTGWETTEVPYLGTATDITSAWVGGWHRAIVSESGEDHILYSLQVRRGGQLYRVLRRFTDFEHLHRTLAAVVHPVLVSLFAPLPRKTFFALNDAGKVERARGLEHYLQSLIVVLQRDSETIGQELPSGLIDRRPELKHPSVLSAADVTQLQAEGVARGLSVCVHSGWLDYRSGHDTQWAPRWVSLIQEAAHAPSSLLHADQEHVDGMSPTGLCWLLVHASATTRDEPQAVIPLASYVVKNKVAQHKFSVIVCGAASTEWVHKFRAAAREPDPASAIFGWVEVMDGTVQSTLQQVLRASVAKLQPDRIVHAGWVEREHSSSSSFFAGKSWDRSWAVLWAEPVRAGVEDRDGASAQVESGDGGIAMRTHWLLFYSGPEAEAPLLAVPLVCGCLAVTTPKTARSGKPSVLVVRFHSRHSTKGWKHVLSFDDATTMQRFKLALTPFTASNSGSFDMSLCSAALLETSDRDRAKSGWLHWLDIGGKSEAAGNWVKRWSVLVPGGSSTETWLVAFESETAAAPVAVAHILSESAVDVVAPPVGCVANGRCIRLTGSLSQVVEDPAKEGEASPPTWKHVAKAWRYLVVAEDDSTTHQWYEAVQRLRTKAQRRWSEGLIQTLKPAVSPAATTSAPGFEDSRKQGLAILLAFLDVVGIRSSSWGHVDSPLPGVSPHAGQNRNRNRTMIQSYIQSRTDVLFSGFLYKQGVSVKSWKKRYVILKDDMLMYQKTAEGGGVKGKRGGVVNLSGTWSVEPLPGDVDVAAGRQHCFALYTHGRTLLLSAETAEQKDAWMAALNKLRSRTGDDALRRGVQGMFGAQANADPSGPLQALLHTLQYEVHSLCEFSELKEKMLEALDAMEPDEHAASLADAQNDLGEMEISPSEVQIKELLAEGFFGKVYRGEYHGLDVAIKKLKTDQLKADDQNQVELIAELRSEVDVLTTLRHPNVVLIMGASTKNPANLFIVTEFLDRGCLYNVIHNPVLTDDQTVRMIEQVVLAVNFLHGRNPRIIHRDLKPLNILVDKNLNIRVGDFGISCRDREKENRDQTQGTFAYMAPEVVTGRASASAESDVFSFGVVLFEWLFIRDNFDQTVDFQNDDDYCYDNIHDFVHTGREPRIPGWWHPDARDIIKQCLAADASSRPNMADVLLRIRELGAICKTDIYALRRYAVDELQGQLCPPTQAAAAAGDDEDAAVADKQTQQTQAKLLHEHPDVLDVVLGLAKYAGTDALCYEAMVTYLGVADGPVLREISEATAGGRQEPSRATVMQAAAVNVLAEMPLTDLCVPGKRWVPLPDHWHSAPTATVGGGGTAAVDEEKEEAGGGGAVFAMEEGMHLEEMPLQVTRSRHHSTSGWPLPLTVPARLLPVCGLLCSLDADVVRWTEEMLSTLPEEQLATSEDVRKTLRKALVSGQFDLDEVTGTMLIEMLSDHFDSDLIAASKQVYELEMVNVMGLLVSGRASAIVPQVYLGGAFNASDHWQLAELGITHVVCMAAECANNFEGELSYFRPPGPDLWDEVSADITPAILPALAFIDAARASDTGTRVLVHCVEGVSRSASVVIALLVRDKKLSVEDALKFVQEKRPVANPNPAFLGQLRALQPILHDTVVD